MLRRVAENRLPAVEETGGDPAATGFATAALLLRRAVGAFGCSMLGVRRCGVSAVRVTYVRGESGDDRPTGKSKQRSDESGHETQPRPEPKTLASSKAKDHAEMIEVRSCIGKVRSS